jgi:hypothetical protein
MFWFGLFASYKKKRKFIKKKITNVKPYQYLDYFPFALSNGVPFCQCFVYNHHDLEAERIEQKKKLYIKCGSAKKNMNDKFSLLYWLCVEKGMEIKCLLQFICLENCFLLTLYSNGFYFYFAIDVGRVIVHFKWVMLEHKLRALNHCNWM